MSSEISTQLPSPYDVNNDKELCPVCRESEIQTRFLPCIHVICEPCLQDLIKCSEGNTFKCPLCRKEYYVDTLAPVKIRQYGEQNNLYAETFFSSQGNLTTISERVQNADRDRRLADRVIRGYDPRINQRRHTHAVSSNESECARCVCKPCIQVVGFVCMLHLILVAIVRFILGMFMVFTIGTWNGVAIFEIVKGATDFIFAITLCLEGSCRYLKHLSLVLVLASVIVTGFGTYAILTDDFNGTFIAWYTIMDWLVIFCIILYICVCFFIKQN
ncbi:uncharacterized protein LOC132746524 [Ruditapes philippinarum]|uniref:uncharacterized protein LOC132746524 n=1 Tax=Ruditapes philippinarum TaxID=129788 RepID=UPI00295C3435|nr:uncharacterized protein LOC132746524 [Ruditapes philippinarum]XP_060591700.1 uncharacterized protein LOC132746524 [Ruditapes philippinarum]